MSGTVLVVGSSARTLALRGGAVVPTGNYLNEMIVPMQMLRAAGFDLAVATPDGARPPLDARSVSVSHFDGDESALAAALGFYESDASLRAVASLRVVLTQGLDAFDGFFVPGGHAPITDLAVSEELGVVLRHAHQHAKPTAMICHGPVAALSAMSQPGAFQALLAGGEHEGATRIARDWPYRGYRMTIFSDSEERPVETSVLGSPLTFSVAGALAAAGATVEHGPDYASFAITDRELITGQNPRSDRAVGARLIEALIARQKRGLTPELVA